MSEHYQNYDPHELERMAIASEDFDYPDEEDLSFEQLVERRVAELVWDLLSRLSQVPSPTAHALWYALQGERISVTQAAKVAGVSRQRMSVALRDALESLEMSRECETLPPTAVIRFRRPVVVQGLRKKSGAGPSAPKRVKEGGRADRSFCESSLKKKKGNA